MNEVEQFLAGQKRFRCNRMNASLTQEQCRQNRNRNEVPTKGITKLISCEGCPGLGEEVTLPPSPPTYPSVTIRFQDPEDLALFQQLQSISTDLEQDVLALLHLAASGELKHAKPVQNRSKSS